MATDHPPPAADPPAAAAFEDWVKGTRDRLAAEESLAPARLPPSSRPVPKWFMGLLLVSAAGSIWLAVTSPPAGPPPRVQVRGRIHDIYRQPVAGALVFLVADPRVETRTNPDGSFRLTGVPPGEQTLLIVQEDMGEEYPLQLRTAVTDIGDRVYRVPPQSVRRGPGGGADWGTK